MHHDVGAEIKWPNDILIHDKKLAGILVEKRILKGVPCSVVGIGMRSHTGVAAKMFRVLSGEGINIKVITTSEIKISVLVDRKYMELAVQALHDAFELEKAA
mgnify:CR=1 FL=1